MEQGQRIFNYTLQNYGNVSYANIVGATIRDINGNFIPTELKNSIENYGTIQQVYGQSVNENIRLNNEGIVGEAWRVGTITNGGYANISAILEDFVSITNKDNAHIGRIERTNGNTYSITSVTNQDNAIIDSVMGIGNITVTNKGNGTIGSVGASRVINQDNAYIDRAASGGMLTNQDNAGIGTAFVNNYNSNNGQPRTMLQNKGEAAIGTLYLGYRSNGNGHYEGGVWVEDLVIAGFGAQADNLGNATIGVVHIAGNAFGNGPNVLNNTQNAVIGTWAII